MTIVQNLWKWQTDWNFMDNNVWSRVKRKLENMVIESCNILKISVMKGSRWQELAGAGRSWQELTGAGSSWQELAGADRSYQELAWAGMSRHELAGASRTSRSWQELEGTGRSWQELAWFYRYYQYTVAGSSSLKSAVCTKMYKVVKVTAS